MPSPRPSETAIWIAGYCHFDVTRYEWVNGYWRERDAPRDPR
jgi:hypothetical protein